MVFAVSSRRVVSLLGKEPLDMLEPLLMGRVRRAPSAAKAGSSGVTVHLAVDSGTTATALLSLLVDKPVTIYTTNGYACRFTGELCC